MIFLNEILYIVLSSDTQTQHMDLKDQQMTF